MAELPLKPEGKPCKSEGADQLLSSALTELMRSIVYIETPDQRGTGSIVKFGDGPISYLMTCHHVIPSKNMAENSCIFFDKENKSGNKVDGKELFSFGMGCFVTDPSEGTSFDVTLIAIKTDKVPKFNGQQRLELDLSVYKGLGPTFSLKENDVVKLCHYPEEGNFCRQISNYTVNAVSGHLFTHSAETHPGSSGAPVFKICKNKPVVVGLHRGTIPNWDPPGLNVATCIHAIWCLLERTDNGLGEVDSKAFAKKGSSQEGSSEVPVKAERSGQDTKYFDSKKFMGKYPSFSVKVKAKSIALKLSIDEAIGDDLYDDIQKTHEKEAGRKLYKELMDLGTPDRIKKVCKAMKGETGNPQMNQLGVDMLDDPDLGLPEKPNK